MLKGICGAPRLNHKRAFIVGDHFFQWHTLVPGSVI